MIVPVDKFCLIEFVRLNEYFNEIQFLKPLLPKRTHRN